MKNSLQFLSLIAFLCFFISCFPTVGGGFKARHPLHILAEMGNIKEVKRLLDEGEDIHLVDYNWTALTNASFNGQVEMVSYLISRGADPNKGGPIISPLHVAKNIEVAKILLDNGADINFKDSTGKTPLQTFIRYKNTKLALFLIAQGADIHHIKLKQISFYL